MIMTDGFFNVRTSLYNEAQPIPNARVYIKNAIASGDATEISPYNPLYDVSPENYDYYTVTGTDGKTAAVRLAAPDVENSLSRTLADKAYSLADVYVEADGYIPVFVKGVQIFPSLQSELPLSLEPYVAILPKDYVRTYNITPNTVLDSLERPSEETEGEIITDILSELVIPSMITVHLGNPSDNTAMNVTLPFADYIKNVASSEIFPTWEEEAIKANVLAQISLALNRIYTEWYSGRGYPFDITNSTRFDQAFVNGRNIYDNIGKTVDEIFNSFLRKGGNYEPFFAQYCDGVQTNCDGMSQWGSQRLAQQGYTALDILRNYYGNDIYIDRTDRIEDSPRSYPGSPLSVGSVGEDVLQLQIQLDRIRDDYPLIPPIDDINGRFNADTDAAVRTFQGIFDLTVDGIVGSATWYKISRIYTAVTKLGELTSEGTETYIPETPPDEILKKGSSGNNVRIVQYILEYLSYFYMTIPGVTVDGYFGESTENSVIGFQKTFGIVPDGIVGPQTWNYLYRVSTEIINEVTDTEEEQRYPGSPLRVGDSGRGVQLMKEYYNRIAAYYGDLPQVQENDIYDTDFTEAVKQFQRRFDLDDDGIIGALTWTRIIELYNFLDASESRAVFAVNAPSVEYPGIPLRRGMSGRHVKYIQNALNVVNKKNNIKRYLCVNGEYNLETEMAVRHYRKTKGIGSDGAVNRELWNMLIGEADAYSSDI